MKQPPNDVAVTSSEVVSAVAAPPMALSSSHRASEKLSLAVEDPSRDASSVALATTAAAESVLVERRGDYSAICKWTISNFPKLKPRALWSKYFEVGGFDCRLLIYPKGDGQALPGYVSIYLQIMDPRNTASSKWDCFASYRLSVDNVCDSSKSVHRDSWHRFSSKKKSHGWCDFASFNSLSDPMVGFLHSAKDCILITADILILHESFSFSRDNYDLQANNLSTSGGGGIISPMIGDVLSGKFTWKVHNFSLFKDMIKTQKIMSPVFPAGECNLRISVYQSVVNGVEYLSMCLESKDTEKNILVSDRSCWCLFRMSVLNQKPVSGTNHIHRDSYGRFAADNRSGDNTSLGWNDYMKMTDFMTPESGFLVEDTSIFSTSFHVIKELSSFSKNGTLIGGRNGINMKKPDGYTGKFTWRIENFTRLKDLLKKRKITGLCIKSRRFQIGNRDCRLIVYPRGQSQPPCYLSVFLEVTDSRNTTSEWSCFVSHRLSVVNQRIEEKSVAKESQNRYSKAAKDWGWREFVTLTSLFDQDSGFLVQDTVIFSAEVLILKETSIMQDFTEESDSEQTYALSQNIGKKSSFTWKVENFLSFKDIMETRKIFSKFFQAGGCDLRIGVYESFDTICIYLESDQSAGNDPDKNFWIKYRMAIVNQKNPSQTIWKESSICTKTWNNSVLQFMKVSDMLEADAGFLLRDSVMFVCEILDCSPWFEFSDLEVLASDDDQDALTTDPDELVDSDDSEGLSGDEEEIFRNLLSTAGFHLTYGDNLSQPEVTLREKLLMDAGAIAGFLTGLRVYLDDPAKLKRLLLPTKISCINDAKRMNKNDNSSPSLMNLLMGVKVLQQAIIDFLLDIMVECCKPSEGSCSDDFVDVSSIPKPDGHGAVTPVEAEGDNGGAESTQSSVGKRLESGNGENINVSSAQLSDVNLINSCERTDAGSSICPPETSASTSSEIPLRRAKTKWPQSEELLGLIVNSLGALDGAVPQGCAERRRRPQSAQKIALVLDKAPKHLQPDLVALVPKLVEHSEHPLAACSLLDRLQKPDAEPSLRLSVFGALSQLECSSEVWERVLSQSLELLADSNDEAMAATVDFIFKAALHCQHLPEAVRSVRIRLKSLGTEVSPCVLDYLSRTVNSFADISEAFLRDIDCDNGCGDNVLSTHSSLPIFGESEINSIRLCSGEEQDFHANAHFADIYLLIEMLSIPCLAIEAAQTFERAVARGTFGFQSLISVLESCLVLRLNVNLQCIAEKLQQPDAAIEGEASGQLRVHRDDFTLILGLAETLALSKDSLVKEFVKILYTMLFKWYADESHRLRMLKRLVDHATTSVDDSREIELGLEILVTLACEEREIIRPVLSIMREVAELANVDRAALWHQLCASENEIFRIREESSNEITCISKDKNAVSQKLSASEAANSRLKSEMKAEMDRFARERKELTEQIHETGSQLEWVRAEKDEEMTKLMSEKRILQDRLHDAETQLFQLKSRKRDELKRVMKEKNALAERLKGAETARKRFDEELKRFATENVTREEIQQSLEDEIRRLNQTVGQTKGEKREKEEQVARCETYIDGMESKLQACEQYIHHLETQLQEEMSRHAPLYGAGLEALSMKELETISHIHEEGLRQILAIQQCMGSQASSPRVSPHTHTQTHGLCPPPTPPQVAVGLPPPFMPNGVGIHTNGHVNGEVRPWFNHH